MMLICAGSVAEYQITSIVRPVAHPSLVDFSVHGLHTNPLDSRATYGGDTTDPVPLGSRVLL